MKKYLYLALCFFLITDCNKEAPGEPEPEPEPFTGPYKIIGGCYMGRFTWQGQKIWNEICFDTITRKYVEWPSGGILVQKEMGCLTVGSYSIDSNKLIFILDSLKFKLFPCPSYDMKLPGEYKILKITKEDSLIFERGTGYYKITYRMKRVWP